MRASVPDMSTGRRLLATTAQCNHSFILSTIMDIINNCLSLTPVPCLDPAFSALKFIWSDVKQTHINRSQLEALTQSVAQLLQTLHEEYREGRLVHEAENPMPLTNLCRFVKFIMLFTSNAYKFHVDCWTTSRRSFRMWHRAHF